MKKLCIITPCSRPENLNKIYESIIYSNLKIDIRWLIILDKSVKNYNIEFSPHTICNSSYDVICSVEKSDKTYIAGHGHRNHALDIIKNSCTFLRESEEDYWVYQLDDDNILHPDISYINDLFQSNNKIIIFSQELKDKQLRLQASTSNIKTGHIDSAQFLCNLNAIGKTKFLNCYDADGRFIEQVCSSLNVDDIKIVDKPLSYYNYLR